MIKRISKLLLIIMAIFTLVGCNKNETNNNNNNNTNDSNKNIQIMVYDKKNNEVYNEKKKTKDKYLVDLLNSISELKVVTEDSQYGKFITSIMDIKQGNNYYWNYYVNGIYAEVGISSYEIKDNDSYTFKLEKFE